MIVLRNFKFVFLLLATFSPVILYSQETLNWTNDIPSGGWPSGSLGPHSNATQCHSRGTFTSTVLNPSGFIIVAGQPSNTTFNNNSIIHGISSIPNANGISQTFSFGYPVENLTFSIFDIDGASGNWQDRLIVTSSLSGAAVPVTISTCPPAAGVVCTGSGTTTATINAGTTSTGFTSAAGRADYTISGALDSVTIQYHNHTVPTSTTQFISITELTYDCAIVGVSKTMTRRAGQANGVSPYIVDIDFSFENFGDVTLSNLTAPEDLDAVFNVFPNTSNYSVTAITKTSGPASFTANASFDGSSTTELIGSSSSLLPGETASIRVTLNVNNYDSYTNTVTLTGTTPQSATTNDNSTDGADADGADGDNNPDESTPSNLNTTTLPVSLNYIETSYDTTNNVIIIEWQTDIEYDHIGFQVFQENNTGEKQKQSGIIHEAKSTVGQSLKFYSTSINSDSSSPLWLAEINNKGTKKWYGPITHESSLGAKIVDSKIDWQSANLDRNTNSAHNSNSLKIAVKKTGMQRIAFSDLIQTGMNLDNISPNDLSITLNNSPVPLYINGNAEIFDNSTSIDFYGNNYDSIYTDARIYKLASNGSKSPRIKLNTVSQSTALKSWYWHTEIYNPNLTYDFSSPTNDPWRAEKLATFASNNKSIQFPLDELSTISDQKIQLALQISGAINYELEPDIYPSDTNRCGVNYPDLYPGIPNDHCIELTINNQHYDDVVFDGLSNYKKSYQLDQNVSTTGVLSIDINLPGETGYPHDIIHIESIGIKYPRKLTAIDNKLEFQLAKNSNVHHELINELGFEESNQYDNLNQITTNLPALLLEGFSQGNLIAYALDSGKPTRIQNTKIISSGLDFSISIPAIANSGKYWVSTEDELIVPSLSAWSQSETTEVSNIEYIIISHPSFITSASQIKEYHQSNGLNVALVNVDDIYKKYSASIIDPYAIKEYIAVVAKQNPLKYILLVGSDNYDYKGYLSNQHFSHIPSIYTTIDDIVRYAPSDNIYADVNNDDIPDIAIGRLPVRSIDELQLLIDKQMTYVNQTNQTVSSHFIADAQDDIYSYAQISSELNDLIPDTWNKLVTNRDDYATAEATKTQILDNFTYNPRLTTYLGHSGPRNWFSFPPAFTYNDIIHLDNNEAPSIVMQWGCWNSYYVEPDANTMAHRFLFDNDNGAVAVFGASALTTVTSEKLFAELIIPEMVKENQPIGISMLKAKSALAKQGEYRDIIMGWNLLGDPAIKLINTGL